jgi:site-specific DNA-methyltransferase (adenine-specific)
MNPYYQDDAVTIYHGDCREILPLLELGSIDLVLTDPPYGVGLNTGYAKASRGNLTAAHDYPLVFGDDKPFDPVPWLQWENVVLWGANYYSDKLPQSNVWLIWDKRDGIAMNDQADCELAWTRGTKGTVPRTYHHLWNGMLKDSERDQRRVHPTQKPVALMAWCLNFYPNAVTILDPFMGSGTTLRAAKDLGRKAIGIEIEERYCEIAAKRMSQSVMELAV